MATRYVKNGLEIVVVATIGIVAMLLLSEPKAVWNDGACEKLSYRLKAMGLDLLTADERGRTTKLDPEDFIPRSVDAKVDSRVRGGRSLAQQYGVQVSWRQKSKTWKKLLFYPIALSQKIVMRPYSNAEPTPQIVMVPVDEEDLETLPNLNGCQEVAAKQIGECQFRRMKTLFAKQEFEYAATLLSDGSVRWLPIDELGEHILP